MSKEKDIAYYSACLNAWIQTRMEKNKHLLTLSSLGIGLLMVFYKNMQSNYEFILWLCAGISFVTCIFLSLRIYSKNAEYILSDVTNQDTQKKVISKTLKKASKALDILFIIAITLTFLLSVAKTNIIAINFNFDSEVSNEQQKN